MPRTATFSKHEIIKESIKLVRRSGFEALTARELGRQLNCSTSPLFTVFGSFEEVKAETLRTAFDIFNKYVSDCLKYQPAFKEYGRRIVAFGKDQPNLFKLVLMRDHEEISGQSATEQALREALRESYNLTEQEADFLVEQNFIFAVGMGAQMAFGSVRYTDEEINERLGASFLGSMNYVKHMKDAPKVTPQMRDPENNELTLSLEGSGVDK